MFYNKYSVNTGEPGGLMKVEILLGILPKLLEALILNKVYKI